MDSPSSLSFTQLPVSPPLKEAQEEKDMPKGRIQSVEPEIESLGAVGGEGASCVTDAERSTVAVSPSENLNTFSAQEKKQTLLYGTHPISPVTEFTEDYLKGIFDKTVELAAYLNVQTAIVPIKMAALRVQTLIIKMMRGEDSDDHTKPLMEGIDKLNDKCLSLATLATKDADSFTEPRVLWFFDTATSTSTNPIFLNLDQKIHQEISDYLACPYTNPEPTLPTRNEELTYLNTIIEHIKRTKNQKEQDEKSLAGIDIQKETKMPEYYFLHEEDIKFIEAHYPNLRSIAKECKIFIVSLESVTANNFERKLLTCYNLYSYCVYEKGGGDDDGEDLCYGELNPTFYLHIYKELLRDNLNSGEVTTFQSQQIACCTWMMCLSKYFSIYTYTKGIITPYCIHEDIIRFQFAEIACKECLELTMWAKDNGFINLATHYDLTTILSCVCREIKDITDMHSPINKLFVELSEHAVNKAIGDKQKWIAHSSHIRACEMIGDKERYNKAFEAASQYSFYPVIIEIWRALDLSETAHPSRESKNLRPDYAIEYLIKMANKKNKLLLREKEMDSIIEIIHYQHKSGVLTDEDWSLQPLLYCYIAGKEEEGKKLLQYGKQQWHIFFVFISLIAQEQFKRATTLIENALTERKQRTSKKILREKKVLRHNTLPLLALLHKRIADTESCDIEKTKHLKKALSYLHEMIPVSKGLYLFIAIIQEKLNFLEEAYSSYSILEEHYKTFSEESSENCQLYFISQAKEKLRDMLIKSAKRASTKDNPLQLSEKNRTPIKKRGEQKPLKIQTTKTDPPLTPKEKGIILPHASTIMDKTPEADTEIKEAEECIQYLTLRSEEHIKKDNDTDWTVVLKNRSVSQLTIPKNITNKVVDLAMASTKKSRYFLYTELLHTANIDYHKLFITHDTLYNKYKNITLKQVILQNKMWSMRHKTFNSLSLNYESRQSNVSVDKIKIDLRAQILNSLYSNIENVLKTLTSDTLPEAWRNNPNSIFTCKNIRTLFECERTITTHFRRHIGAQFSTIAHVMRDISLNQPHGAANMKYALSVFGMRDLNDFYSLSKLFYRCRDRINPEHSSS